MTMYLTWNIQICLKLLQNELDTQSCVDLHDLFLTCVTLFFFPLK